MSRSGEAPGAFALSVLANGNGGDPATIHFTVLRLPGPREDLFPLVTSLAGPEVLFGLSVDRSPVSDGMKF